MKLVNSKTATIAAAAGLVALGGASGAVAGTMVTSAQIKNGTIRQIDIGHAGVSGHGAAGQSEIQSQSLSQADIAKGGVSGSEGAGGSEIQHGSVGLKDLASGVLQGITGSQGPAGDTGSQGLQGIGISSTECNPDTGQWEVDYSNDVVNEGMGPCIGQQGPEGKSAYQIAAEHGYTGTEADFAAMLLSGTGYEVVGRNSDRVTVDAPAQGGQPTFATVSTLCNSHNEYAVGGGVRKVSSTGHAFVQQSYPSPLAEAPQGAAGDANGRWIAKGWTVEVANMNPGGGSVTLQPYVVCMNLSTMPSQ